MSDSRSPQIEQARLAAAQSLPPGCNDDFLRLSKSLVYGPTFQWLLVDAPDEALRRQVMAALERVLRAAKLGSSSLPLSDKIDDVAELERRLAGHAGQQPVVHLIGRPGWFTAQRWDAFNVRRERIAAEVRAKLVFWLDADAIELASRGAPDLWAWRSGVYAFMPTVTGKAALIQTPNTSLGIGFVGTNFSGVATTADPSASHARADEINAWLATEPPMALRAEPIRELGRLLRELGDDAAEMTHWQTVALPYFEQSGDVDGRAEAQGQIAELLAWRGDGDAALALLRGELLPQYEANGNDRSRGWVLGLIADILTAQGRADEALRIRREQQIPLLERVGAVRERAVALGRVAEALVAQGRTFEALAVRADEELPAYELMRDQRGVAMTRHNIATLLAATGRVEEALALLRDLLSAPQQLDGPALEAVQRQIQALLTTRVPRRPSMPPSTTA